MILHPRADDAVVLEEPQQIIGGDAAALSIVAPITMAAGVLAIRRHPAAPVLALAPSTFVVYTYTQLMLGNEFLRLPGNVERFFPLLLAVFLLATAIALRAWRSIAAAELPATSVRADSTATVVDRPCRRRRRPR